MNTEEGKQNILIEKQVFKNNTEGMCHKLRYGVINSLIYVSCSYVFVRLQHHKLAFAVPKVSSTIHCYFRLLTLISIFINLLVILCHVIKVKARIDPSGCTV